MAYKEKQKLPSKGGKENTISGPLGRGGTPSPAEPNLQSALGRRESGEREAVDRGEPLKGPLGR